MARSVGTFSQTSSGESELYTFDFVNDLVPGDSILSIVAWTIAVIEGDDPNDPQTYAQGPPTLFGTKVTQKAIGFLPGVEYTMAAQVMTQFGQTPILWSTLTGQAIGCCGN